MTGTDHPTEELSALLDGELEGAALQSVEGHLACCASCSEELLLLKGALSTLSALEVPLLPSAELRRSVLTLVAKERLPGSLLSRLSAFFSLRLAVPLVAVGAAATLFVVTGRGHDSGALAEDLEIAARLELLKDYDVVEGLPENLAADDLAVVAHLDELER